MADKFGPSLDDNKDVSVKAGGGNKSGGGPSFAMGSADGASSIKILSYVILLAFGAVAFPVVFLASGFIGLFSKVSGALGVTMMASMFGGLIFGVLKGFVALLIMTVLALVSVWLLRKFIYNESMGYFDILNFYGGWLRYFILGTIVVDAILLGFLLLSSTGSLSIFKLGVNLASFFKTVLIFSWWLSFMFPLLASSNSSMGKRIGAFCAQAGVMLVVDWIFSMILSGLVGLTLF